MKKDVKEIYSANILKLELSQIDVQSIANMFVDKISNKSLLIHNKLLLKQNYMQCVLNVVFTL